MRSLAISSLFLFSSCLFAAPIDEQTPIPDSSVVNERNLSRQYCIESTDADALCSTVQVHYPAGMNVWINDFIEGHVLGRLDGVAAGGTLTQAIDAFLHRQVHSSVPSNRIADLKMQWIRLGQNNQLTAMAEQITEQTVDGAATLWRQFVVLDGISQQPLLLADVLLPGQGESLAVLQEKALIDWFVNKVGLSLSDAQLSVASLPIKNSSNWSLTQQGLVFGYDQVLLAGQSLGLPLIMLSADTLEGIVRPDILTAARSWPVNAESLFGAQYRTGY